MENPSFYLEGILHEKDQIRDFEGPLNLILVLLQKNKIEIRDIVIADILDQYLDYLNTMKGMNLEIASEFIDMASFLIYIKTKMLVSSEDEEISELESLMESLEQLKARDSYVAVKEVVPDLLEAYRNGSLFCSRPQETLPELDSDYPYSHKPEELLMALLRVYSSTGEKPVDFESIKAAMPARIVFSVRNKSRQILERLKLRNLFLNDLYAECSSRSEIVATFISVLELVSMGSISVFMAPKGDGYEITSGVGNIDEILEKIEE